MNLFEAKAIYDSKTGKFLEEFYINSNSVDCDEYYFYLEREKDVEDKKSKMADKIVKEIVDYNKKIDNYMKALDENPYEYVNEDEICECDECKYKDKKKYESCDDNCKYMNCDECCNDFCESENDCCEDCKGCKVEEFDYGELLEIFAYRIQETNGNKNSIKSILDEFADIFIPDYDEDEFKVNEEDMIEECNCDKYDYCNDEFSDQQIEEIKLITSYVKDVLETEGCPNCIFDLLSQIYFIGKEVGWDDCKEYVKEILD